MQCSVALLGVTDDTPLGCAALSRIKFVSPTQQEQEKGSETGLIRMCARQRAHMKCVHEARRKSQQTSLTIGEQ